MYRLWRALINSWNGLRAAAASEQAVREELIVLALSVPLASLIGISFERSLQLVIVVLLVLIVELLNTAIEKLADRVTLEHDPIIKRVKDMGSAAVLGALAIAGLLWLFAIAERFGLA